MIVVEAMDFECLVVIRLIVNVDVMHGLRSRVPEDQRDVGDLSLRLFVCTAR